MSNKTPKVTPPKATLRVSGVLAEQSSVISSCSITLSCTTGRIAEEDVEVLAPFMSCRLNGRFSGAREGDTAAEGASEGPERKARQLTLSFDNVAFLLMQFSEEFLEALETLDALSSNGLAPSKTRLNYATQWLEEGATALAAASRRLVQLIDRLDEPSAQPTEAKARAAGAGPESETQSPKPRIRPRKKPVQPKAH